MGKLKRTVSAVMAVMVALNIFVGLAAAITPDVYAEPPDVSDDKSGAYPIVCTDRSTTMVYQADISSSTDRDWFKCNVNAGEKIAQLQDWDSDYGYVSLNAEDNAYPVPNFVERLSRLYLDAGTGIVPVPPLFTKIVNDKGYTYYGYQFFIWRNM